ncbi:MAG: 4-hydroxythreonine-4-phosphate dehydrogenase PdxA [Candidatus Omnitrophota bacterium]|nr:4-hydroxythreonine-4-phosphate dehydrogenase PdxA [Candidatus Omnitrophota bacterium]
MRISRSNKARVVITMGDPSGIGPEVTLKALASPEVRGLADFLVIGEELAVRGRAAGKASLEYIDKAVDLIRRKEAGALVTAPVSKSHVRLAGFHKFQGHTEYLAEKFKVKNFAMMFVGDKLKVTLATRHIPLKSVSQVLNPGMVYNTIELTYKSLKEQFAIRSPRIAVCGLNPHAGEGGAFGNEERRVIAPAIIRAAKCRKNIFGPMPADIAFHDALNKKYDAVVAMYHDQALAPFKMLYFDSGVNVTLGLPFVRTSPDHGTAFDIAGKGIADPRSMIEAIKLAVILSEARRRSEESRR